MAPFVIYRTRYGTVTESFRPRRSRLGGPILTAEQMRDLRAAALRAKGVRVIRTG